MAIHGIILLTCRKTIDRAACLLVLLSAYFFTRRKCITAGAPRLSEATTGPKPHSASEWNCQMVYYQNLQHVSLLFTGHTLIFCLCRYAALRTSLKLRLISKAFLTWFQINSHAVTTETGTASLKEMVLLVWATYCACLVREKPDGGHRRPYTVWFPHW